MSLLAQLDPYSSPNLPVSSRMDPSMQQRQGRPFLRGWGIADVCQLGWLVAGKANHLASELIAHKLYGPRKPSWGVEMTIITSFLRDAGKHSSLADITFIRALTSLSSYLPSSTETHLIPLSFRVRSLHLRGLLETFDSYELGGVNYDPESDEGGRGEGRTLAGEWVVDKGLWRGWQRDWRRASSSEGSPVPRGREGQRRSSAERPTTARWSPSPSPSPLSGLSSESTTASPSSSTPTPPPPSSPAKKPRVILYLHGGAYYAFSASTHRSLTAQLSLSTSSRIFALNYRLSPETRFPGPLHDAVSAYLRLYETEGVGREGGAEEMLVAGDSAGGGLCLGLLMYLRDNGYPLPSGAILMSPWVDLTMSCDSWDSNAPFDIVPIPEPGDHLNPVLCYLGPEGASKYLTHPYASPLFGDFRGLPPMLVQSGEAEVLRDEITLMAHKATLQGVKVMHEVFEDCVHVFQSFPFLSATKVAFNSQRDFVLRALPAFRQEALDAAAREAVVSSTSALDDATDPGLVRSDTASTSLEEEEEVVTPSGPSEAAPYGGQSKEVIDWVPDVPPIPPKYKRSKSSVLTKTPAAPRPTLNSYRSHPAPPAPSSHHPHALLSLFRAPTSATTTTLVTPEGHSAVPPTPPKTRGRSQSHPDIWAMVRGFEQDEIRSSHSGASGERTYTVKRFGAAGSREVGVGEEEGLRG